MMSLKSFVSQTPRSIEVHRSRFALKAFRLVREVTLCVSINRLTMPILCSLTYEVLAIVADLAFGIRATELS